MAWRGSMLALASVIISTACENDGHADARARRDTDASLVADAPSSMDGAIEVLAVPRGTRVFEIRQPVSGDGAPVASNNYFCAQCVRDPAAEAAFDAFAFPDGWIVAPRRTIEAASATLFDSLNSRGAPLELDFIPSIDGPEFRLGAQPLFGEFVDGGIGVVVTMESSRRLSWNAGDTIYELQGDGHTYVLFDQVREAGVTPPDAIALPAGWTHQTRVLDAPFVLQEVPRVVVFMNLTDQHLWQRVDPP